MTHTPSEETGVGYESYESEEDEGAREAKDGRGAQGGFLLPSPCFPLVLTVNSADDALLMHQAQSGPRRTTRA